MSSTAIASRAVEEEVAESGFVPRFADLEMFAVDEDATRLGLLLVEEELAVLGPRALDFDWGVWPRGVVFGCEAASRRWGRLVEAATFEVEVVARGARVTEPVPLRCFP